jgi:hypothetical protein
MDVWTIAGRGLPVRGGPLVVAAKRLTGVWPCGHSGGGILAAGWGKEGGINGEAAWLGWAARAEEGGVVAATAAAASQDGGDGLAFSRRKEKRERAKLG